MMHNRKLGGGGRARTHKRQAPSPCPTRNGTEIGTVQKFNLLCNTNLDGNLLDSVAAFDLPACADICSSFHPRCDGATFDGTTCQLKARLQPGRAPPSRRLDSVVGIFTSGTSNCATLSGTQSIRGTSFTSRCGSVIAGFDLSQNFAPTFQDCMGQCTAATGCAAVSYEATQDQGFKNCYLKTAVSDATAVVPDLRTDTALMVGAGNAVPGGDTGVSTVPVPAPAPVAPAPGAATTGAVFFTPPGLNTAAPAASTAAVPPAVTPASSVVEVLPTGAASSPIAPPVFFPSSSSLAVTGTAVPDSAAQEGGGSSVSSNAWIAAPVVGSVAAIALIILSFIMLKRRRAGARSPTSSSSSSGSLQRKGSGGRSRTSPVVAFFSSFLPSSSGNKRKGNNSSSGNSRMGNFSEVTGKQPASRASMRTSVTGLIGGPGMRGMERLDDVDEERGEKRQSMTPSYEVRSGKMELRNSFNGLGQHRVA
ncbi:hypothetical protein B0H67DRAFT_610343 [Lasiosphaeris hirsuta]|uniref:Apple domain-containing protein n=1 Tax=Lasiosphaeris hirsuta TaxID=260670 RepID=A0AA40AGV9_9PEZI|nr:hypothetical protein B0H67DRAFT_610343 [Lasiosphaeris hirsuta]